MNKYEQHIQPTIAHLLLILCCVLQPLHSIGQNRYYNGKLKALAVQLHLDTLQLAEGTNHLNLYSKERVVIIKNAQTITHIGYSLFNDSIRLSGQSSLFRFLERYLFMLNHPSSEKNVRQMLRDDEVKILKGNPAAINTVKPTDTFTCRQTDMRYMAEWTRGDTVLLRLQFPASYQLLSGDTKPEAENRLASLLRTHQSTNNDTSHNTNITITLLRYGYAEETIHTTLEQWTAFCRQSGCEINYGVESEENGQLHASLIAINKPEGYNHVMALNLNNNGNNLATLHAYVPMHNVSQLFAKNQKTKNKNNKLYVR